MASHYGDFVFRPSGPLSGLDSGVENQTGKILRIEAHAHNQRVHNSAATVGSTMRFGQLETGFVVQIILPLLLVLLGFGVVAGERESGLLRLSLLQGTHPRTLIIGKAIAIWLVGTVMFCLLAGVGAWRIPELFSGAVWPRLLVFGCAHIIFLWVVAAMTVACSSLVLSARTSLSILLVIWCMCAAVLPPLTAHAMHYVQPLPSFLEFKKPLWDARMKYDPHSPEDEWAKQLREKTLQEHGVSSVDELAFNMEGLMMDESEACLYEVWQKMNRDLREKYDRQTGVNSFVSLVNPIQAIDAVSMSLAGTDLYHELSFDDQVSEYRLRLIKKLNEPYYQKSHVHADGSEHAHEFDEGFFASLEPFRYENPPLSYSFATRQGEWFALLSWFGISTVLLAVSTIGVVAKEHRMIQHAIRFEWRAFLRQPGRWLLVIAYIACGIFAIRGGWEYVDGSGKEAMEGFEANVEEVYYARMGWFDEMGRDSANLYYDNDFVHIGEPPILKSLVATTGVAHGVADFLPREIGINLWSDPFRNGGQQSSRIENPESRIKGGLDLVFVFVFLLPLVQIILCYDINGYEVEQGMQPLLSVQVSSPFRWMLCRVFAVSLGLLLISLSFCLVAAFVFGTASQWGDWGWLCLLLLGYAAVWTAIIVMVLSFQRSSSESALLVSLIWIVFCMLIPATLAQQTMAIEASDYGVDMTLDARNDGSGGSERITQEEKELIFEVYPELEKLTYDPGQTPEELKQIDRLLEEVYEMSDEAYEMSEEAYELEDQAIAAVVAKIDGYPPGFAKDTVFDQAKTVFRFRERLELDQRHLQRFRSTPWLSPSVATQMALERLSGVGLESTIAFR